jgi:hypothetical protein
MPKTFIISLLLLASCARVPSLSQSEAQAVGAAAQSLLGESSTTSVASDSWPEAVRALKPKSVRTTPEGLYIETSSSSSEEAGIFVPRNPDAFHPSSGTDPEYKLIDGNVFSYRIRG